MQSIWSGCRVETDFKAQLWIPTKENQKIDAIKLRWKLFELHRLSSAPKSTSHLIEWKITKYNFKVLLARDRCRINVGISFSLKIAIAV